MLSFADGVGTRAAPRSRSPPGGLRSTAAPSSGRTSGMRWHASLPTDKPCCQDKWAWLHGARPVWCRETFRLNPWPRAESGFVQVRPHVCSGSMPSRGRAWEAVFERAGPSRVGRRVVDVARMGHRLAAGSGLLPTGRQTEAKALCEWGKPLSSKVGLEPGNLAGAPAVSRPEPGGVTTVKRGVCLDLGLSGARRRLAPAAVGERHTPCDMAGMAKETVLAIDDDRFVLDGLTDAPRKVALGGAACCGCSRGLDPPHRSTARRLPLPSDLRLRLFLL
jgi:hypothetical protein